MKILSIDAWADSEPGTWTWNNWFNVGEISKEEFETLKTDKDIANWFFDNGFTSCSDLRKSYIDDDGHNVVICERKTGMPVFAIEYGPEYY